jgi:hypothetical protein
LAIGGCRRRDINVEIHAGNPDILDRTDVELRDFVLLLLLLVATEISRCRCWARIHIGRGWFGQMSSLQPTKLAGRFSKLHWPFFSCSTTTVVSIKKFPKI